jgi:hypothetical protein
MLLHAVLALHRPSEQNLHHALSIAADWQKANADWLFDRTYI